MSIDTTTHHEAHEGHHEAPEVVFSRQRLGVWLFIGGDIVTLAAMMFTYLYLRGVNTNGHWMSMLGYQGHSYTYYENVANSNAGLPAPTMIHVNPMSAGLSWLVTAVVVISALVIWGAERSLRTTKNAKAFTSAAWLATVIALVAVVLSVVQLHHIPSIFVANNDSQVMAYTTYSSAMMMFIGVAMVHYVLLAFLGLGLAIRTARGAISGEKPYHATLVRMFWVWVGISAVIVSLLTTTVNTVH